MCGKVGGEEGVRVAVVEFERGVDISRDPSLLLNQTACHCCAGGRTEHQVVHIWKCGTRRRGEERRDEADRYTGSTLSILGSKI